MKKNKDEVIELLETMAILLEFQGANPFKIRAFHNAARALEGFSGDFSALVEKNELQTISGIGKGISADIIEFCSTGKVQVLEELKKSFPETLFEILKVPGLGSKKAKVLYEKLDIKSLGELEYACLENRLIGIAGFGEKTQKKILEGIQFLKKHKGLYLYSEVIDEVLDLVEKMESWKEIDRISIAGSLRRGKETVHDADIVCSSKNPEKLISKFKEQSFVGSVLSSGPTKTSILLTTGLQIDLRVVQPEEFIYALHHFTGSKEHNTWMRGLAKDKGLKMNEYGLWKGSKTIPCKTEEDLFKALGLHFIPPELREGFLEIEGSPMPVPVSQNDIKGFFHMHTNESDGKNTLEEMVQKAAELGFEYMGISDHSQSAYYANGLKESDIRKQHAEIDSLQKKYPKIRLFKGIESDILADGSLDYPDKILKQFDFVIASVHSKFNMTEEEMTDRCVNALKNPHTTMLGHPTGRLLLGREGFKINLSKIIDAAAKYGKILELNANPHRLDLDWRILPLAKKKNVPISINPDAHSINGIDDVRFGVIMARKGGLEKSDIFNTLPVKAMEKRLEEIKNG